MYIFYHNPYAEAPLSGPFLMFPGSELLTPLIPRSYYPPPTHLSITWSVAWMCLLLSADLWMEKLALPKSLLSGARASWTFLLMCVCVKSGGGEATACVWNQKTTWWSGFLLSVFPWGPGIRSDLCSRNLLTHLESSHCLNH